MPHTLDSIRTLMAEGEIGEAIEQLLANYQGSKHENTIILQSSRYKSVQKERDQGIIAGEAANIEIARISNALLNLIKTLEKEAAKETLTNTHTSNIQENPNSSFRTDGKTYKIKNIYNLISASFDNASLVKFCFLNFEKVHSNFTDVQSTDTKIMSLIDYARRNLKLENLLSLMKEENPAQYEKHEPYF